MNIDELTIGQAKELSALFSAKENASGLNQMIGKDVIVRTYSAGCWFGVLHQKSGSEVILKNARRMWRWKAKEGVSLSACALYGIDNSGSKIVEAVDSVWLEAIEVIPCATVAAGSLKGADNVKAG
jgi:hypothetical protein